MPKVPSEPLYNHNTRLATSRQISVSVAGTTGRRNVSLVSSLVALASQPPPLPDDYYPMPMDVDLDEVPDATAEGGAAGVQSQPVQALPGIKVLPKVKAKRYENSVCLPFEYSAVVLRLTCKPGCTAQNLDCLSR